MRRAPLLAALLALTAGLYAFQNPALQLIATVKDPLINEMSGIAKSRKYANTYWVHNDSGDQARIFAVREDGTTIIPTGLDETTFKGVRIMGAANRDWEDIATDGKNLYISDLGNNGNARKDLGIYVIEEPNPLETDLVRHFKFLPTAYEDQTKFPPTDRRFDCEAIFWLRGKLYAVTKHRFGSTMPAFGANLYRLDTQFTDKTNQLKKIDGSKDLGGWVTAADVSPDGKTLAVLVQAPFQYVWLFDTSAPGDKFLSKGKGRQIPISGAKQCEALTWTDNKTILVTNEQREIFRLKL